MCSKVKNDILSKRMYLKLFANVLIKVVARIYRWVNEVANRHIAQAKRIFYYEYSIIFINRI